MCVNQIRDVKLSILFNPVVARNQTSETQFGTKVQSKVD